VALSARYTIAYNSNDGVRVDLCRIMFGGDGSYYVTAPYHPANRARRHLRGRLRRRAAEPDALIDAVDLAVVDDDRRRLKIAHHIDGFLQFSGEGIRSGRDANGNAKGIGLMSWPLHNPTSGPAFQLGFSDPIECGRPSRTAPAPSCSPSARSNTCAAI
jgi:hypothetical protein